MDIKDARIDMIVRGCGQTGKIIKIESGKPSGYLTIIDDCDRVGYDHAALFEPVSDPCASCEMAATITSQCKQIAELQRPRDAWKADAERLARNAQYWREELEKLQNEALECKPLGEVAKIYIQVEPDKLLMSQAARRVVEYLAARDCPVCITDLHDDCALSSGVLLDALAEARDAGRISLVNGKYEIVRD